MSNLISVDANGEFHNRSLRLGRIDLPGSEFEWFLEFKPLAGVSVTLYLDREGMGRLADLCQEALAQLPAEAGA